MNPEEEFARLHDQSLWAVAPLAPRRRTSSSHSPRWVMQWAVPVVAGIVLVGLVLAGGNALRSVKTAVPAVPTPTATSRAAAPTQVFGGQCSRLYTDAQVSGFLAPATAIAVPVYGAGQEFDAQPYLRVVQNNGGIACRWQDAAATGDGSENPWLQVMVVPASADAAAADSSTCTTKLDSCRFTVRASGYLLSGTIGFPGEPSITHLVADSFRSVAASADAAPAGWVRAAGDWPARVDCVAFVAGAGLEDSLGQDAWSGITNETGFFYYPALASLGLGHGGTQCTFASVHADDPGYISYLTADVLAGGAWLEADVLKIPGAQEITVDGADRAIVVPRTASGDGPDEAVFLFSGSNAVEVFGSNETDVSELYPAFPGILRSLDAL